jgi:hypothetical protein
VPLELDVPGPERPLSVYRPPGAPTVFTAQADARGLLQLSLDPEHAGPSRLQAAAVLLPFRKFAHVESMVLTIAAGKQAPQRQELRRLGPGRFAADVRLPAGAVAVTVVAHLRDGTRLRNVFDLKVPASG